jgi:hypothetical protein
MKQSPTWVTNRHSAGQEIVRLRNPKFHYRFHKTLPLVPILSHMNPVHTFPPYFRNIHIYA